MKKDKVGFNVHMDDLFDRLLSGYNVFVLFDLETLMPSERKLYLKILATPIDTDPRYGRSVVKNGLIPGSDAWLEKLDCHNETLLAKAATDAYWVLSEDNTQGVVSFTRASDVLTRTLAAKPDMQIPALNLLQRLDRQVLEGMLAQADQTFLKIDPSTLRKRLAAVRKSIIRSIDEGKLSPHKSVE